MTILTSLTISIVAAVLSGIGAYHSWMWMERKCSPAIRGWLQRRRLMSVPEYRATQVKGPVRGPDGRFTAKPKPVDIMTQILRGGK